MALSSSLLSQFAKVATTKKQTPTESTVYGTVSISDGKTYVQIDGSELKTPVNTTSSVKDGDRVTVMIKNHTAIITGNATDPSASSTVVAEEITRVTRIEADYGEFKSLSADHFTAVYGKISILEAEDVTITGKLTAAEGLIEDLTVDKLSVSDAEIAYAKITSLDATNASIRVLEVDYGEFKNLTVNNFTAVNGSIDKLTTNKLDVTTASITYATIANLNAATARIGTLETNSLTADSAVIKTLQTDVADIDTLIFGSAGGSVIQSSFSNAVVAQIGTAQIKSAMIESIAASKITSGDIITNNVRVKSEDGSLLISDETIQISDTARVRVQIGKDASGDYSINIWDADGNLMFSEGGITDSAIKEAIIRNDMVTSDANISASKLDIDSLFTEINGSTNTIKSSKVFLDKENQTLDVAFTAITSDVESLDGRVTSQGTSITVIQGQINNKIWQTDIDTAVGEVDAKTDTLTTQYSELNQELNEITATVAIHTTQIANKADGTTVTTLTNRVSAVELDLSGFKSTVSETYTTKTEFDNLEIGGRNLLQNSAVEKTIPNGGREFLQYADIAPIIDEYGLIEYTISFDIKSADVSKKNTVQVYCQNGSGAKYGFSVMVPVTTEYTRQSITVTPVIQDATLTQSFLAFYGTYNTGNFPTVKNVKIEKGNKATDWTPAPEDMATAEELSNQISTVTSSIEQNTEAIKLKVSTTEFNTYKTTVSEDIDLARADAAEYYNLSMIYTNEEIATVTTNLNATNQEISIMKGQIALKVEQTDINTAISGIDIGGRNYIILSKLSSYQPYNSIPVADGNVITTTRNTSATNNQYLTLEINGYIPPNEYMTLSGYVKVNDSIPTTDFFKTRPSTYGSNEIKHIYDPATGYFECTQLYPGNSAWIIHAQVNVTPGNADVITFTDLKFEKGNKATDWTPAPEDVDSSIAAVSSEVTSVKNTVASHTTSINSITSRVSSTESNITTINGEIDSIESRVKAAELKITDDAIISTVSGTYATKTALAATDAKATTANNYVTNATNNYGYQYKYDITLNGDAATYYPVVFRGGNQNVKRTIFITRSYNEKAPAEWEGHGTTKGISLLLKIKCNFGGWGGANYGWVIEELEEMYGNLFASAGWNMSYMAFEVFLRGGGTTGALYHIYSDQELEVDYMNGTSPQVYYYQEQIGYSGDYKWNASAPRTLTDAVKTEINNHKLASEGDLTKAETRITQTENKINLQAKDISTLGTRVGELEVTSESITARVSSAEGNISTLQQTANGLTVTLNNVSSTASTAVSNAATAKNAADAAQSTANTANSTANSVKTDLAKNYQKKTLPDTRNDNQTPIWYINNYPQQCVTEFKYCSVIGLSGETYCALETIVPWTNSSGGYPKQVATVKNKQYWRVGTSDTAWGAWNDATTTATNYLNFSSAGLVVGDMTASTLGKNVLIDSDSVDIRNGTTTLASFSATEIYLAKTARDAVIDLCGGTAKMYNNYSTHTEYNRLTIESEDEIYLDTDGCMTLNSYHDYDDYLAVGKANLVLHSYQRWAGDEDPESGRFNLVASYFNNSGSDYWDSHIEGDKYGVLVQASDCPNSGNETLSIFLNRNLQKILIEGATDITGKVTTSDSLTTGAGVLTNGKTSPSDGNIGAVLTHTGNLHLQGSSTPLIRFYTGSSTTYGAQIYFSDSMRFEGATAYRFDAIVRCTGNIRIGDSSSGWSSMNHVIQTYWADSSVHNIVDRASDGLTAAFGWAGSSSYATVTKIRGRTCQYQNSSGTTALSDERLKKDFIDLDRYDGFFDSLEPCGFKMKTGNSGRYHIGFKAQQVEEALTDNGLTSQDFAGYIKMDYVPDDDDPERTAIYEAAGIKKGDVELGLIYTELTGLNTWQIQKLKERVVELERIIKTLTN